MSGPNPSPELQWEAAYARFETPEQEIEKFTRRLQRLDIGPGADHLRVVELFAGRANGLEALARLGFRRSFAVDRSFRLISSSPLRHRASAADARELPLLSGSVDLVIVQGGLHHLEKLPDDLDATLSEIARVLRPGGRVYIVEPALTLFLAGAHAICRSRTARRLSRRVDALATMIELEMPVYARWLDDLDDSVARVRAYFETIRVERRWGKLLFAGRKR